MKYRDALAALGLLAFGCAGPKPFDYNMKYKKGDITVTHVKGIMNGEPTITNYRVEGAVETAVGSLPFSATENAIRITCEMDGYSRELRYNASSIMPVGNCPEPKDLSKLRSDIAAATTDAAKSVKK